MENIIQILIGCGVFGYLIKIENRMSKIETFCKLCSKRIFKDETPKSIDNLD